MRPVLTDDHKAALIELLREKIAADRFPLSPRVNRLRAFLAKLDPPGPAPRPFGERSVVLAKKRRR
jgi:hypothetical protein